MNAKPLLTNLDLKYQYVAYPSDAPVHRGVMMAQKDKTKSRLFLTPKREKAHQNNVAVNGLFALCHRRELKNQT
jgi:hypothetical protein